MKKANLAELRMKIGETIRASQELEYEELLALIKKKIPNYINECEPLLIRQALLDLIRREFTRKRQIVDELQLILSNEYGVSAKLSLPSGKFPSSDCGPVQLREIAARKRTARQPDSKDIKEAEALEHLANELEENNVSLKEYFSKK